jgi:hypothetical protein
MLAIRGVALLAVAAVTALLFVAASAYLLLIGYYHFFTIFRDRMWNYTGATTAFLAALFVAAVAGPVACWAFKRGLELVRRGNKP